MTLTCASTNALKSLWEEAQVSGSECLLDVGSGDGYFSAWMAERLPNGQVVGIDRSSLGIDYASQVHQLPNLSFQQHNILEYQPAARFDLITLLHGLHLYQKPRKLISHLRSFLKPTGKLLLLVYPMTSAHAQWLTKGFKSESLRKQIDWEHAYRRLSCSEYTLLLEGLRAHSKTTQVKGIYHSTEELARHLGVPAACLPDRVPLEIVHEVWTAIIFGCYAGERVQKRL